MVKLFERTTIKSLTLSNRFVRSATYSGMASDDGAVTPQQVELLVNLAKGGVGLIISDYAYITKDGAMHPRALGIYNDHLMPGLNKLVDAIHQAGGKIVIQLAHGGAQALSPQRVGVKLIGPSAMTRYDGVQVKAMTNDDIHGMISAFAQAATRAKRAGFDGVQLHAAHGYLLSEFLSPFFNKRTDAYGSSVDYRAQFVIDTYQCVREAVGKPYPVMIKINSEDYAQDGLTIDMMLQVAKLLEHVGIDAIELSGGIGRKWRNSRRPIRTAQEEVYYHAAAQRFKEHVNIPLMLVGGIRSYAIAKQLVKEGVTDYVSLCRPLIRDPHLINRWRSGDTQRSTCISCRACMNTALQGQGLHCVQSKVES